MERYIDVHEIEQTLSVGKTIAYRIMRDIGYIKIGGIIRVSEQDFRNYITAHRQSRVYTVNRERTNHTTPKRETLPRKLIGNPALPDSYGRIKRREKT